MSIRLRLPVTSLAIAALVAAPVLATPLPAAHADGDREEKEQERDEVNSQLEDLRIQLDDVNEDLRDTYLDLAETELLIPQAQQDVEDAQAELEEAQEEDDRIGERLDSAEQEEAELTGQVESGQEEVDAGNEELSTVALSAYKGGEMPNPATVYLGGESPQDAVDRTMNYRLTMSAQGTRLDSLRSDQSVTENSADRLTAVREEIDDLKTQSEEAVERRETAKEEADEAKQDLEDLYSQQQTQRDTLETKKAEYEGQQSTLESRSSTLDGEIEELAEQERRRLEQQQNQPDPDDGGSDSGSTSSSGWMMPVNSRMNSNFGWRVHPIYGTRKLHAGVDFPVACGTPVKATRSGTVLQNTYNSSAGNKLILSHGVINGKLMTSSYHHLQSSAVSAGQSISAGQTVAYVGTTGSSTGCHLHFEIHEDGNAVNPTKYV